MPARQMRTFRVGQAETVATAALPSEAAYTARVEQARHSKIALLQTARPSVATPMMEVTAVTMVLTQIPTSAEAVMVACQAQPVEAEYTSGE